MKVEAGAEFVFSQPIYEPKLLENFLYRVRDVKPIPVFVGVLPLASLRNAEFLHNEVPGMQLPDRVRKAMADADEKGCARERGIELAQEALLATRSLADGVYVMAPAGGSKTALAVLAALGDRNGGEGAQG